MLIDLSIFHSAANSLFFQMQQEGGVTIINDELVMLALSVNKESLLIFCHCLTLIEEQHSFAKQFHTLEFVLTIVKSIFSCKEI